MTAIFQLSIDSCDFGKKEKKLIAKRENASFSLIPVNKDESKKSAKTTFKADT